MDLQKILKDHSDWLENEGTGAIANLQCTNLQCTNLQGAKLQGANLQGAKLQGANMIGAKLQEANLQDANLQDANLRGANMQDAKLQGANMIGANMIGANMIGANLQEANLPKTDNIILTPWGWGHIQRENIRIGCQYHSTEKWEKMSDNSIAKMDNGALDWWKVWKPIVLQIAAVCEPYREEK